MMSEGSAFTPAPPDAGLVLDFIRDVVTSGQFILKEHTARWESELAEATGAGEAVACASRAGALALAARAAGVRPGDTVAVPGVAHPAVFGGLRRAGAELAPVPVHWPTGWPTLAGAEASLGAGARAIVVVHPLGAGVDMAGVTSLAQAAAVPLIEDISDAHGFAVARPATAARGTITVLDTGPGRPLGGIGEAAAILTDDPQLAAACRMLRNHGQDGRRRFLHHQVGYNCRLDELSARYLIQRLAAVEEYAPCLVAARQYAARLTGLGLAARPPGGCGFPDGYAVVTARRNELLIALTAAAMPARALLRTLVPGACPAAERLCRGWLALPLQPQMSAADVEAVCTVVAASCG